MSEQPNTFTSCECVCSSLTSSSEHNCALCIVWSHKPGKWCHKQRAHKTMTIYHFAHNVPSLTQTLTESRWRSECFLLGKHQNEYWMCFWRYFRGILQHWEFRDAIHCAFVFHFFRAFSLPLMIYYTLLPDIRRCATMSATRASDENYYSTIFWPNSLVASSSLSTEEREREQESPACQLWHKNERMRINEIVLIPERNYFN